MSFEKDFMIKETMSDAVEGGTALAWRLLATLEGGSLLLATSALLAYTVRNKLTYRRERRNIRRVLVTNTTNLLGRELKKQLEYHNCEVETLEGATSEAVAQARSGDKVDAIVVVGADPKAGHTNSLDGMANLVTEDVYSNLKLLESLSTLVHRGGCLSWACAGAAGTGSFSNAAAAFDTVLQASLQHIAKLCECEAVWVGRYPNPERAAQQLVSALLTPQLPQHTSRFSVRNAAQRVGECLCRWLKIIT